ncbi:MAG: biotin transporter BioY [Aestuariivirgaceae bacterium]|nr:biotin transporter BioY [Aestuariivirgaceae bacterium]
MSQANMTVAGALWPASRANSLLRAAVLVALGTLALAVAAKVQVPFWPVPVTMQSLVVLALGAAYGWRLAGVTLFAYLLEGAAGLPVFASGAGAAYMMGPTGGYLVGFALAAMLVGYLAEKGADKRPLTMFAAMLAGAALIYVPGIAWLSGFTGVEKAVAAGFVPFIMGDVLKAALAAAAFPAGWSLLRR